MVLIEQVEDVAELFVFFGKKLFLPGNRGILTGRGGGLGIGEGLGCSAHI